MLRIITAITFLAMITVNALANILPINGVNTGQVSDYYPNLFAPAAITFAIWGLIYLLLAGYTLFQLGLFQGKKQTINQKLLRKVDILFSLSSVANAAWIFSWHYFMIPLSLLLMIIILACLILINIAIQRETLSPRERFWIRLPFSVYFGWITVATIANVTTFLVSIDWNGFGLSESFWTIVILIVGMMIGTVTMIRNRDMAYGLVLVWAYKGIWLKHTSDTGFAGQYPGIINTVIACLVVFGVALIYLLVSRKKIRKPNRKQIKKSHGRPVQNANQNKHGRRK